MRWRTKIAGPPGRRDRYCSRSFVGIEQPLGIRGVILENRADEPAADASRVAGGLYDRSRRDGRASEGTFQLGAAAQDPGVVVCRADAGSWDPDWVGHLRPGLSYEDTWICRHHGDSAHRA